MYREGYLVSIEFVFSKCAKGSMSVCAQVDKSLNMRSDVGDLVGVEVRVSNTHSTDIAEATLDIFYPARAAETGDFFYLLPDCGLSINVTVSNLLHFPSISPPSLFYLLSHSILSQGGLLFRQ